MRLPQLFGMSENVAPYTGAWIEIVKGFVKLSPILSPPIRGRGLKYLCQCTAIPSNLSPPIRGRGLKSVIDGLDT